MNIYTKYFVLVIITLTCNYVSGLFEDQVGKFDWKHQYIGRVNYFYLPPGYRKIVVATQRNLLATLNPRTRQIGWRQILEKGTAGKITAMSGYEDNVMTVSGDGQVVRSWNTNSGLLNWETVLESSSSDGSQRSFHQLYPEEEKIVHVEVFPNLYVQILTYNVSSGSLLSQKKIPAAWIKQNTRCLFISQLHFVCKDDLSSALYSLEINEKMSFNHTPLSLLGINENSPIKLTSLQGIISSRRSIFALRLKQNHVKLMQISSIGMQIIADLPNVEHVDVVENYLAVLTRTEKLEVSIIDLKTSEKLEEATGILSLPANHGRVKEIFGYIVPRKDGGLAFRLLLVTEDHSLSLIQAPDKLLWTREEALASILAVEMVDLPVSDTEAQMEQEFRSGDANMLSMLLKRITTQLIQLDTFVANVISGFQSDETSDELLRKNRLTRDEFNLHKMIIIATSPGKIYGIDSPTGMIVWQQMLPTLEPFKSLDASKLFLFVQRTTAHFPHPPQCAVLGKHKFTGEGLLFTFNPITGHSIQKEGIPLGFRVVQTTLLPYPDEDFLRGLIFLDEQHKIHAYPKSAADVAYKHRDSIYIFTADVTSGLLIGFSLAYSSKKNLLVTPVWTVNLPPESQLITHVVIKRSNEHIDSLGRVMGDRSVMYKYLNPNLVAVLSEGQFSFDSQKKPFFNILLLDVATGHIVFSATHKRCRSPLHVVHAENWVVYGYYNEKARRTELAVLELYEGKTQSNTTHFSSLNPPNPPMIERQAYILPSGLDAATVTITERGITSKHLLFALPFGGILELPKALLDPRRPLIPTQEHREEGIYPYIPELPVPPESIINYNRSVQQVEHIYTAPAGLESTCLVLAYGLDLFYTRVTPSRTFDVLKDDFDHLLIAAVLLGLILASYITRRLSARKALHQAWK